MTAGVVTNKPLKLTKGQRICLARGYHDDQEFIDPKSGGFTRCKDCGLEIDREEGNG